MPTTVSSVTSVTAMDSMPDEKQKKQATCSVSLCTDNMVCCVMNLPTVVVKFGAAEFYFGVVFVLKHSLVCTLILA